MTAPYSVAANDPPAETLPVQVTEYVAARPVTMPSPAAMKLIIAMQMRLLTALRNERLHAGNPEGCLREMADAAMPLMLYVAELEAMAAL
jgi:hypothetical protein